MQDEAGREPCTYMEEREYLPTERIASVVWALCEGGMFTVTELADEYGLSRWGAQKLLMKCSRGAPILCYQGKWMSVKMANALQIPHFPKEDELPD